MFNRPMLAVAALLGTFCAQSAILQRLTMDEMIAQSTEIVRGRVTGSAASFRGTPGKGGTIYTHYTVAVVDRIKGAAASTVDVAVPGGISQGLSQTFAGAPTITNGQEYVLFLWTSRSGLTQVIGLTQGLFGVHVDASGNLVATRAAANEMMLDPANGQPVQDTDLKISLPSLLTQIQSAASRGVR